jgi:uncharacterized protein (DUF2235 family)
MAKNIVICCDGTGNQIGRNLSNVLKLFRITQKNETQRVYYGPGVGTIGGGDRWARLKQNSKAVFGLATGYGLDADILEAYRFICEHHEHEDSIFLFGFSRGAYAVRALAAFIHMAGLLPRDQLNIANYALTAYKRAAEDNDLSIAWNFSRIAGGRRTTIKFIGVWDTVASILVPRGDRIIPTFQMLPYTRRNPSVQIFRQAIAIDERRRMFRLNRWLAPQPFKANPFDRSAPDVEQDIKQVWFAGAHADVGGGYPEAESALSKYPLDWLITEAVAHGLKINVAMRNHLVLGKPRAGGTHTYVAPDPTGQLHQSLASAWWLLEWVPKSVRWEEWPRLSFLRYYIPNGEPRQIANQTVTPRIHQSVLDRMRLVPSYKPINLPESYATEPYGETGETAETADG